MLWVLIKSASVSTRKHVFVEKLEKYQYFLVKKVPYLGLRLIIMKVDLRLVGSVAG